MKCQFCEAESTNHIEVEHDRILELCGKHYNALFLFFTASPAPMMIPQECPSYTKVIDMWEYVKWREMNK